MTIEQSLPQLAEGWEWSTLGDVFYEIKNGTTATQNKEGRGVPVTRIETIQDARFDLQRIGYVDDASPELIHAFQYHNGDIAFSHINSLEHVGKTALYEGVPEVLLHGMNLLRLRLGHDSLHPRFLHSVMQESSFREGVRGRVGRAVNQVSINQKRLSEVPLPIAPLAEQPRIVAKLDELLARVNSARDHLSRVPAILKRFRQAVLSAACSGKLTEEWRGSSAHDWKECTLAQIVREPLRNGHSARASLNGSGVRTLTLSAVTYGDFSERNTKLTVADPRRVADLWLLPGDILIERSNSRELVGTARLYQGAANFAIFPDLLIRVRLNEEASPAFLEMVLQADSARNYFISSAQGTQGSMPKIDQQIILDFPLQLPPMKEQKEIVQRVTVLLTLASQIEERINAATARSNKLTQSVLSKAFRGELVPTEAELARREGREYEPASVLLERIKKKRVSETPRKARHQRTRTKSTLVSAGGKA